MLSVVEGLGVGHTMACDSAPSGAPLCAEMDYDAATEDEPAGEVLLRGPQLFSGYYKQVSGADGHAVHAIAQMLRYACK